MPEQLNLILICEANLTKPYKQAYFFGMTSLNHVADGKQFTG